MSLTKYLIRRLIAIVPIVFGVMTLTFFLSRMMPMDPVLALLKSQGIPHPDAAQIAAKRHALGLDLPIIMQYFRYLVELLIGEWGDSYSVAPGTTVMALIARRLPRTIDLALFSMIIAAFIGIKVGVISATNRNKAKDSIFRGMALIGVAFPIFFLGMLMQFFLGYKLDLFPTTGFRSVQYPYPDTITGFFLIDSILGGYFYLVGDYLIHMAMPVFCLSFVTLASIVRQSRSSMLEVLEQDYVRTARAKGCKERDVINTHALKNSLIPTITVIGLNFASLLTGAVLTETTFGIYGIGLTLVDAIQKSDYWVLNGVVFMMALIFVLTTLITDIAYGILDPRIRY